MYVSSPTISLNLNLVAYLATFWDMPKMQKAISFGCPVLKVAEGY
jgi:hypothetical protein